MAHPERPPTSMSISQPSLLTIVSKMNWTSKRKLLVRTHQQRLEKNIAVNLPKTLGHLKIRHQPARRWCRWLTHSLSLSSPEVMSTQSPQQVCIMANLVQMWMAVMWQGLAVVIYPVNLDWRKTQQLTDPAVRQLEWHQESWDRVNNPRRCTITSLACMEVAQNTSHSKGTFHRSTLLIRHIRAVQWT